MIKYIIIFSLIAPNAFALKLGDLINGGDAKEIEKNISLDNITDGLKQQANKKISTIEERINQKIDSYDQKIQQEINKVTQEIEDKIAEAEKIKNQAYSFLDKAESALKWLKIVLAIISSGIIILLFLVFRAFVRIKKITRIVGNIANYKEIDKRLSKLEKIIAKKKN